MLVSPGLHLFCSITFIFTKHGFGLEFKCLNGKQSWMLFWSSVVHMGFHNKLCLFSSFWWVPVLVNRRSNRQTSVRRAEEMDHEAQLFSFIPSHSLQSIHPTKLTYFLTPPFC